MDNIENMGWNGTVIINVGGTYIDLNTDFFHVPDSEIETAYAATVTVSNITGVSGNASRTSMFKMKVIYTYLFGSSGLE